MNRSESSQPQQQEQKNKPVLFSKEHLDKAPHARWLNKAIRSNRWGKDNNVTITYEKGNGDVVERKVKPLVAKGHLLVAHDHHRDAIRSFHIERIRKMEKTAFQAGFEKRAFLDKMFGNYDGLDAVEHLMAMEDYHGINISDKNAEMYANGKINFNPKTGKFVPKDHPDGVTFVKYLPMLEKIKK